MTQKNKIKIIGVIIVVLAIIGFLIFSAANKKPVGGLDVFTQCLKKQGVIFYGAFWCPHCQRQKSLFAGAAKDLPYVECSTPDGQGQLSICVQNNIHIYPTWVFTDGSRLTGETPLDQLASKANCSLSQ